MRRMEIQGLLVSAVVNPDRIDSVVDCILADREVAVGAAFRHAAQMAENEALKARGGSHTYRAGMRLAKSLRGARLPSPPAGGGASEVPHDRDGGGPLRPDDTTLKGGEK